MLTNDTHRSSRELDRGVYDDSQELVLLNALHAPPDSKLRATLKVLARVATLSHILFWKKRDGEVIHRVELPRLRLSLTEREGRLYSVDHADLAICSLFYLQKRPELERLTAGIPHSLVLVNSNHEPSVLIPLVRPVRPFVGSSVFSTELVLDRVSWGGLATKYLLLPVHVSLSFLQTPTLASALYLLALRFLARDYEDVQRLVSSVSTDTELTSEEAAVMKEISGLRDGHPNAHAARLHLTLALIDAPQEVVCVALGGFAEVDCSHLLVFGVQVQSMLTWDVPNELYKYLNKLAYVAMSSRLDREAEVRRNTHNTQYTRQRHET